MLRIRLCTMVLATGALLSGGCSTNAPEGIAKTHPDEPIYAPGFKTPPVESAETSAIADDEEVIGISSGGRHRAYRIAAMKSKFNHIVNDLVGQVPVSVTYCVRKKCVRAFSTGEQSDEPLKFIGRGWVRGRMLLELEGRVNPQESDEIAVPEIASEVTTWKEWKAAHPDTDVYTGQTGAPGD